MFGDGHCETGDIDFLKSIPSEQGSPDLTRDGNDRRGVHVSGCQSGDQIGGAGTRCGDADSDPAGSTGISVRRVGGALFMHGQHMP